MATSRRAFLLTASALAVVAAAGCVAPTGVAPPGRYRREETFQWGFSAGLDKLTLSNENGNISADAWSQPRVDVRAIVEATAASPALADQLVKATRISFQPNGAGVLGTVQTPPAAQGNVVVTFTLQVPRDLMLDLSTTNGDVAVSGVAQALRLRSTNGSVRATGDGGRQPVTLRTENGNVELRGFGGGGQLETTNGAIELTLPAANAVVDLRTVNGPITVLGATTATPGGAHVARTIGAGGALFSAQVINGSITVRSLG